MLVKELIEELRKFPEEADVIITGIKHKQGYHSLNSIGTMRSIPMENIRTGIDCTGIDCPVLIF